MQTDSSDAIFQAKCSYVTKKSFLCTNFLKVTQSLLIIFLQIGTVKTRSTIFFDSLLLSLYVTQNLLFDYGKFFQENLQRSFCKFHPYFKSLDVLHTVVFTEREFEISTYIRFL